MSALRSLTVTKDGETKSIPCPYRKLNPDVLMVQTPEVRVGYDAANGLNST